MGDAGEGLIDADSRIQERLEELESARAARRDEAPRNPEALREAETLRLARTELERQLTATSHERRRAPRGSRSASRDGAATSADSGSGTAMSSAGIFAINAQTTGLSLSHTIIFKSLPKKCSGYKGLSTRFPRTEV
jgi:hypothetical protein